MLRKDELKITRPLENVEPLSIKGEELSKFEILMKKYSPYFRLGMWIEFIWRW